VGMRRMSGREWSRREALGASGGGFLGTIRRIRLSQRSFRTYLENPEEFGIRVKGRKDVATDRLYLDFLGV